MKTGRKGFGEELHIKQRYSALTEPYFNALKGFLESEDKSDRKFAISELTKAYAKMIPTQITGEEGAPIMIQIAKEVADKHEVAPDTSGGGEGQP
jgi:hypothetical protein